MNVQVESFRPYAPAPMSDEVEIDDLGRPVDTDEEDDYEELNFNDEPPRDDFAYEGAEDDEYEDTGFDYDLDVDDYDLYEKTYL